MTVNSFLCALAVKLIKMMDDPKDGECRRYTFTFVATRDGTGVKIDEPALSWKTALPPLPRERE